MKGNIVEKAISVSKFRGALVGVLLGDCCGAPFEGEEEISRVILQKYFDKMEDPSFKSPVKKCTDDTVMTRAIAESLVHHAAFHEVDIAKRFVTNYFQDENRGYGNGVVDVFRKLRSSKFEDIWRPAREQFHGEGSLGNGGAMRITPVALFCYSNTDLMIHTATKCTQITHTHPSGVNGALVQAIAVQQCLLHDSQEPIDNDKFTTDLINKISEFEAPLDDPSTTHGPLYGTTYVTQLQSVQKLLKKSNVTDYDVVQTLGVNVTAVFSVPTAIYCFLRAQNPIDRITTDNKLRRTVQYSISLGGDTDTIGGMAGALAGACYGIEAVHPSLFKHLEGCEEMISLADELHSIAVATSAATVGS